MLCPVCTRIIPDESTVCPYCVQPVGSGQEDVKPQPDETQERLFVYMSYASSLAGFFFLPIVFGPVALILAAGGIARKERHALPAFTMALATTVYAAATLYSTLQQLSWYY